MHTTERRTLARLPSGVEVATTVHRYVGEETGPTLYVQAAQHGREINGTETLRRFHDRLDHTSLAGEIVVVPVADPLTFDRVSYTTPEALDSVNANMNRVWPGEEDGTLHERMAARLWPFVEAADAVVDLHTGSPETAPHVVFREGDAVARELAAAFGTDLLLGEPAGEDADEEWTARSFGGKLRVAAGEVGVPAITPELAHNKAVVETAVESGVTGLCNVCRELGLLDGDLEPNGAGRRARNHLGRVRATESGLFVVEGDVALGEPVAAGVHVGTVYDPARYEPLQRVETDREGIIYALCREATVTVGDALVNVALLRG